MRIMSDLREAMWGVVQQAISELDFDFAELRRRSTSSACARASPTRASASGSRTLGVARDLPESARCVIVGGGVGGCSIAYHLAELGWQRRRARRPRRAHVAARRSTPPGSSASCAARCSLTRMMMDSVELYRTLDCGWVECGGLRLASLGRARWEETRRQAGWAKTFGLPLELISAEEAQERFPLMVADGVLGASWLPTDGYLDPSAAHLRARRGRARGRLRHPHQHARDRDRRARRPRARGADRPRRHRGRRGGQRRRHVRGRDRAAGGRARPARADGARVPRHAAVPRARPGRAAPDHARPRPPHLLPRGRRRARDGRLRAPPGAVGAGRGRRRRHPRRLQRPPARGGLGALRGDHRQRPHARAGDGRGHDHAADQRAGGVHARRRVPARRVARARLLRRRRLLRPRARGRGRDGQADGRVDRRGRAVARRVGDGHAALRRALPLARLHAQAHARGLRDLLRHQVPGPRAPGGAAAARLAGLRLARRRTAPRSARSRAGSG